VSSGSGTGAGNPTPTFAGSPCGIGVTDLSADLEAKRASACSNFPSVKTGSGWGCGGSETVVLATHGFADLPLDYLTPSSPTSPLPDPFIYHSPTNVFFRYIICSKFVQIKFSKVVTRSRRVRA
jgi:hypothetical protein